MTIKRLLIIAMFALAPAAHAATPGVKPGAPHDKTVSRVVGELGETKYFVTSREVQYNQLIEQLLTQMNNSKAQIKPANLEDADFGSRVAAVLLEWVIYKEAESFSDDRLSSIDLQKELHFIQDKGKGLPSWTQLDVSDAELKGVLKRKLMVSKFLQLKSESSKIPVSDDEAEIYFKKNRAKFGNLPFESFRENIKTFLQNSQTEERLRGWFDVLNRKYKVRNFLAG